MLQQIITYSVLVLAIAFLVRKFVFPPKDNDGCGGTSCGCG
ncbi:FeoB-associated Cys-rich membrane protein [Tenacibaculum sp. M341]|nr:FeoB-associated Cys-rich membrane protein [Tenacibaculum sp. M341]